MARVDHKQRSGNSSCGSGNNKSSKKLKQKKIPQRGLGVAQLEKIRIEEQQKKDVVLQTVLQNSPSILAPNSRQNPVSQIEIPVFKTNHGLPKSDPVPFSKPMNMGQGSWGKMLSGEHILEGERYRFDQSVGYITQSGRFGFRPNTSLIYESVPVLAPARNGIPRKELFQQQSSSSPMVKVSSATSSSSVITYNQSEPPSNQSFCSKILTSSKWPEEEKMTGVKRPYPFYFDNSPGPAFPCKFPVVHFQYPIFKSAAESPSCGNRAIVHVEPQKPLPREGAASLQVMNEMRAEKVTEQNGDLNGDFLTLSLPKPPIPQPEILETGPNLKGNADGPNIYSFFPSSKVLNGQAPNNITGCSDEVAEKLDLSLKL